MSTFSPDELLASFGRRKLEDANEAETRLRVIDRILFDVLGWTLNDVQVEERVGADVSIKFADYVLRSGMTAIVVEAKKSGVVFSDPPQSRRIQLGRRVLDTPLGEAVIQARDYARQLGIPFAVATNGSCWIVFPASRVDQVSFQQSSAIVFPTLQSVLQDDYAEFYDLLSRKAVISGSLEAELLGRRENQIEDRRLNRFYTRGFSRISRHSLFPLIEDAVTTAFTEDIVSRDPELLEKCYVRTPERIRFDNRISMHIAKREAVVSGPTRRPMKQKDANALVELIDTAAARARPVALLILGSVGAGKTTFLEYTRRVAAKVKFQKLKGQPYPHWIRVDFRNYAEDVPPIQFLYSNIRDHIDSDDYLRDYEQCIRHAYREKITALFKGPLFLLADDEAERKRRITDLIFGEYGQIGPYVDAILSYAARNSPVFLVVDNVDQLDTNQAAVFSDAMALAHKLGLNLICSLREATYIIHRNSPTFDAFDFDPIAIDPPDIKAVLSRRFFVTRQLLQGKSGQFIAENGIPFNVSDLTVVIDLLQSSVLGSEIGNLIEVLATSDVRLALRMTREFLQSGYTASGRALQIFHRTGKYLLPQHEALRAIMLGNQQVYIEEYSVIGNPFDARLGRTEAQLLRLYILASLVQHSSTQAFQSLPGDQIQLSLRELGYGDEVTLKVLSDLCRLRFVHTTSHSAPSLQAAYIPTRLGGYIVRHLISNFTYIENTMVDTFVSDTPIWERLRSHTEQIYQERDPIRRLHVRKRRAETFFSYMKASYTVLRDESLRRGLASQWCSHPLEAGEALFQENLARATRSATRNYGEGSS